MPFSSPCPHCGTSFRLTADYLAQFGGRLTASPHCGRQFRLPPASEGADDDAGTDATDLTGNEPAEPERLQPTGGAQSLGYAAPQYPPPATQGVWADGEVPVIASGARLPQRCAHCNAAADVPVKVKLVYHAPREYTGSATASAAWSAMNAQRLFKKFWFCRDHARQYRGGPGTGAALSGAVVAAFLIGLVIVVVGNARLREPLPGMGVMVGCVLLAVVGVVWHWLGAGKLSAVHIDHQGQWVAGCGEPFLASLPDYRQACAGTAESEAARLDQVTD